MYDVNMTMGRVLGEIMINRIAKFSGFYTDKLSIPTKMVVEIQGNYLVGRAKTTEVREVSINKFVLDEF